MSEALRRPILRNPRLGHAVGRTARCFTRRTYGLENQLLSFLQANRIVAESPFELSRVPAERVAAHGE